MKKLLIIIALGFSAVGMSQQLVYRPVNPFFGGDTFNYQQLLASADAQNSFSDPNANPFGQLSDIDQFTENINRQLLNRITNSLIDSQLGDGALGPGSFAFGSLEVEIFDSVEGLVINILDINTGEQSQVIIPPN